MYQCINACIASHQSPEAQTHQTQHKSTPETKAKSHKGIQHELQLSAAKIMSDHQSIASLVDNQDWENIRKRLRGRPSEATIRDDRGRTLLHHACAVPDGVPFEIFR